VRNMAKMMFVLAAILFALSVAATSFADPGLSNVPPHRHWINTGHGFAQVGPRVCDMPSLQRAFNQFHNNLHVAGTTSIGPAAPGLHNFKGAELFFTSCAVTNP
jgi:hypothetical protein